MDAASFSHVAVWVFDLDNTLYDPSARLFAQIELRMRRWMCGRLGLSSSNADALRADYWRRYGSTVAGLMAEHGVDPAEFLTYAHDIDLSRLRPDPRLADAIARLPGRRIVFTNGDGAYAARVLKARGLAEAFDAVYGTEHAFYVPKPEQAAFEAIFALDGLAPEKGAMFEDDTRNLAVPHALGMRCIHVAPTPAPTRFIHYHTSDLAAFLSQLG